MVPVPTASERALADGVALYDAGDFNGAIKMLVGAKARLGRHDRSRRPCQQGVREQISRVPSYCVTIRRTLCRQRFIEAIKLDPKFNLEPAEKTHPIWGPEFELARKQATAPPAPVETSGGPDNAAIKSAEGEIAKRRLRD